MNTGASTRTREPILGIDLGTTHSLVAVYEAGGPRVLLDDDGRALIPSVVRIEPSPPGADEPYRAIVGEEARRHAGAFPRTTIASVKRLMGRSAQNAAADQPFRSYQVVAGDRSTARVRVPLEGRTLDLSPEEISAHILRALAAIARTRLGAHVRKAVITVPAYFDDAQRQATRAAGRLAGLDVLRLVPEPTAAALAYGIGLSGGPARTTRHVCVVDLGGGTFDVSVLRITPAAHAGEREFYRVLATSGDTRLGGDDFDQTLAGHLAARLGRDPGSLLEEAKALRHALSEREEASACGVGVERARLDQLAQPLLTRMDACCRRALTDAQAKGLDAPLDAVILVGGATRMPVVRTRMQALFGIEPYTAVDPDKAVALGAAVQAGVLGGSVTDALLLDVIPLSLGLETAGGGVAKIILRNSAVPASATEHFSTGVDNQTSVALSVYQGEREMAADCRLLGTFHLRGIPPMPAGIPRLEVTFLVDANGVLNVRAIEQRSGKAAKLQVVPNHGLSQEEVERIERDSFRHAREDMTRHRVADLIAHAALDLAATAPALERHADSLPPQARDALASALADLRAMVEAARRDPTAVDAERFAKAKEAFDRAAMPLHEIAIAHSLRGGSGGGG
jgi:molecular chaperone DnaK (HSP70)